MAAAEADHMNNFDCHGDFSEGRVHFGAQNLEGGWRSDGNGLTHPNDQLFNSKTTLKSNCWCFVPITHDFVRPQARFLRAGDPIGGGVFPLRVKWQPKVVDLSRAAAAHARLKAE